MRTLGNSAAAFSLSKSLERATVIAMFDWPEPIHTSPTRTSSIFTALLPLTVSTWGPPG